MRMWNINPKLLCRKHLFGEHVEMHMFVGTIKKQKSLQGYIKKGLVEPFNIEKRHKDLVEEIIGRGYNHKSPLDMDVYDYAHIRHENGLHGFINTINNLKELKRRCPDCKKRILDKS